jgi:hypothetical protein
MPAFTGISMLVWLPCLDRERWAVPNVTHLDAMADELASRRLDVGDDHPGLGRARRGRSEAGAGKRERSQQRNGQDPEPPQKTDPWWVSNSFLL